MTRTDYLAELDKYLRRLPEEDYREAMDYFREYFDEAGPENEAQIMAELGTPKEAANDLIHNLLGKKVAKDRKTFRSRTQIIWLTLLAICGAPFAFLLLLGLLMALVGLIAFGLTIVLGAVGLSLSLILAASLTIWEAFHYLPETPSVFMMGFGGGLAALGGAILLAILALLFARYSYRGIKALAQWIIKKGKRS